MPIHAGPGVPLGKRLPSLDGWRAIAIFLVLASHAPYAANFPEAWRPAWQIVFDGDLGVRIFFVLSGFLITRLLLQEHADCGRINLKRFYARRALRIFPLYFSYLGLLAALQLAGLYGDSFSSWLGSLTFTRNMIGRGNSATVHFWSLAIEEQFYLLWPAAIILTALFTRRERFALIAAAVALFAILTKWIAVLYGTDIDVLLGRRSILRYADSLAIGCCAAMVREIAARKFAAICSTQIVLGAALLLVATKIFEQLVQFKYADTLTSSLQALLVATLIVSTSSPSSGITWSFLTWRPVVALGVLSYSLYVWHVVFLAHFMGPGFERFLIYDWKFWALPSLVLAYASHRWVEQPFLRMKDRLAASRRTFSAPSEDLFKPETAA